MLAAQRRTGKPRLVSVPVRHHDPGSEIAHGIESPLSRPSTPIRLLLALLVVGGVLWATSGLLSLADSTLTLWQRLEQLPSLLRWGFIALIASLFGFGGGLVWRLLRPPKARPRRAQPIDRERIETRTEALGDAADAARAELAELDRRRTSQAIHVALFGRVSSGKTSLLRALGGEIDDDEISATAGSTRRVRHFPGELPDGRPLVLADVPGLDEADDQRHAELARAEAARSHVLLYVCDGEPTRSDDAELRAVAAFGKPLLIVLNKADRLDRDSGRQLLDALNRRYADIADAVVPVSAGGHESVRRLLADGREEIVERERPIRIEPLLDVLNRTLRSNLAELEPAREQAVLAAVDQQLDAAEQRKRSADSEAAIRRYTRRAMVGALAAIAPGSDLVIQGALASGLARELAQIHGLQVREVDLDDFLARAGGLLRTSTSVVLAIAGNALKAFPGLGTLSGGLVHAVAYGLIFDSLGRALAQSFAEQNRLDREATLEAFAERLRQSEPDRLLRIARLAREALMEPGPAE